jgi:hypothetical protein
MKTECEKGITVPVSKVQESDGSNTLAEELYIGY